VRGLFAAGDTASREAVVGATSGGGGPNTTWAISSGFAAGRSAAAYAATLSPGAHQRGVQTAGQRGYIDRSAIDAKQAASYISVAQAAMFPLERNFTRDAVGLQDSLARLNDARQFFREAKSSCSDARARRRGREIDAMLATARWICASALERRETRGIHRRRDFPAVTDAFPESLRLSGIDEHQVAWA
jgi:succinate dehydrogenase/fumarate reductase flavoprotein subunit